ncbi:hypothetical protein VAE308_1051459 [Vibrio aestuarianus]|nr:hypothetical protein VAE308_1051459 [Vibrio aestuarianus]
MIKNNGVMSYIYCLFYDKSVILWSGTIHYIVFILEIHYLLIWKHLRFIIFVIIYS